MFAQLCCVTGQLQFDMLCVFDQEMSHQQLATYTSVQASESALYVT